MMDVKRMSLVGCVRNTSMGVCPYLYPSHRLIIWGKFPVVDVEALFIFGKFTVKSGALLSN
jgi:hypothetical protein